jgi:hypothetical protein
MRQGGHEAGLIGRRTGTKFHEKTRSLSAKAPLGVRNQPMTFRLDPELAVRWQRLAERQRDHLLSLRDKRRTFDDAGLEALISGAEYNIAAWAALAGRSNSGDDNGGASEERPSDELSVPGEPDETPRSGVEVSIT